MPISVSPCLPPGEDDLPDDTPLYRYLSTNAFLHLREFGQLGLSRICDWPDAYEGLAFEFLNKHRKDPHLFGRNKDDLYGSCWTLHTEDARLYTPEDHSVAMRELGQHGSAAMWESYCKNGGVRIRTSLGKITGLLEKSRRNGQGFRGKVQYVPGDKVIDQAMISLGTASGLFIKRTVFRHEAEYRYIVLPEEISSTGIIPVAIDKLYDLLDEVLISPATPAESWVSRSLYLYAVGISRGSNTKNGRMFCRISQLYGTISQEC